MLLPYPAGCRTGVFLGREKRFLVHVLLDGRKETAHTNNTGAMTGLLRPGAPVLLSPAVNPRRRLRWTVEAMGVGSGDGFFWAGVNTLVPNRLLPVMFRLGLLPWAAGCSGFRPEAACGESRLDGLFLRPDGGRVWVECKNVTLVEDDVAAFPDAVTERGAKHLRTMRRLVEAGDEAVMMYVVQRPDGRCFSAADYVDPVYAAELESAVRSGVKVFPLVAGVGEDGVRRAGVLPFRPGWGPPAA